MRDTDRMETRVRFMQKCVQDWSLVVVILVNRSVCSFRFVGFGWVLPSPLFGCFVKVRQSVQYKVLKSTQSVISYK